MAGLGSRKRGSAQSVCSTDLQYCRCVGTDQARLWTVRRSARSFRWGQMTRTPYMARLDSSGSCDPSGKLSLPKRSKRYGVGKEIGGAVYVHRRYEHVFGPVVQQARVHVPPEFRYTVVKLNLTNQSVWGREPVESRSIGISTAKPSKECTSAVDAQRSAAATAFARFEERRAPGTDDVAARPRYNPTITLVAL